MALAVALLLALSVSAAITPAKANVQTLNVTITASEKGEFGSLDLVETVYPVTIHFSLQSSLAATSYLWEFGTGANSTVESPTYSYTQGCLYDVSVDVTLTNGTTASGRVVIGMFDGRGPSGSIDVCPQEGTLGFVPVELTGGFFSPKENVTIVMNGTNLVNVTTDNLGHFALNLNGTLSPPYVNGTTWVFTTNPPSLSRSFTTVEGIRASPPLGLPGTTVVVTGHSYSANGIIMVYMAGVYLGTATADGNGTFALAAKVPATPPLTGIGTYAYTTDPPIAAAGTHANFYITGNTISAQVLSWWWLIPLVILIIVVAWYVRRKLKQRSERERQALGAGGIPTIPSPAL